MKTKNYIYFLKNLNDGSFWDGGYSYCISQSYGKSTNNKENRKFGSGFRNRPRFFRNLTALATSLNKLPPCFIDKLQNKTQEIQELFNKISEANRNYYDKQFKDEKYKHAKHYIWVEYKKKYKLTSSDILYLFKSKNWIVYKLEEGKTLKSAKEI